MFCGRCDEPITSGQKYFTTTKISISAGGCAVRIHEKCHRRPGYVRRYPT